MFRLQLTADFDTEEEASAAMSDAEEAIGLHDGNLEDSGIEDLSDV
jgi:hypothetical protein